MKSIASVSVVLDLISKVKQQKKEYLTNYFLDIPKLELWINLKLVEYEENGQTVFIFRRNKGFKNLFFISSNASELSTDISLMLKNHANELVVIDLVGKQNTISQMKVALSQNGFYKYTSLVRMSKTSQNNIFDSVLSSNLTYADTSKGIEVFMLLQKYFDPYAEQLPVIEEINNWTSNNRILIYSENSHEIEGFLIFELFGQTSYLRYWFVHPDQREKRIGSALLRQFFTEGRDSKRQLFWVIESNQNAIKRYEHFGFVREELEDYIMINKNICYEG